MEIDCGLTGRRESERGICGKWLLSGRLFFLFFFF